MQLVLFRQDLTLLTAIVIMAVFLQVIIGDGLAEIVADIHVFAVEDIREPLAS